MLSGDRTCAEAPSTTHTLMFSLVMRGQATFSFHFLIKHVMERSERFSRESCQEIGVPQGLPGSSLLSPVQAVGSQNHRDRLFLAQGSSVSISPRAGALRIGTIQC